MGSSTDGRVSSSNRKWLLANSSPASAASSPSGARGSGAPLGQRPTMVAASSTGGETHRGRRGGGEVPEADHVLVEPAHDQVGAAGRPRREGGRRRRRHHRVLGSCRGSPSRNWPGQTSGWPGLAKRRAWGSSSARYLGVSRPSGSPATRPRTPGWEMPSLNPKCSWPSRLPGRLSPCCTKTIESPCSSAAARTSSVACRRSSVVSAAMITSASAASGPAPRGRRSRRSAG